MGKFFRISEHSQTPNEDLNHSSPCQRGSEISSIGKKKANRGGVPREDKLCPGARGRGRGGAGRRAPLVAEPFPWQRKIFQVRQLSWGEDAMLPGWAVSGGGGDSLKYKRRQEGQSQKGMCGNEREGPMIERPQPQAVGSLWKLERLILNTPFVDSHPARGQDYENDLYHNVYVFFLLRKDLFWLTALEGSIERGGEGMGQFTSHRLGSRDKGNASGPLAPPFHLLHAALNSDKASRRAEAGAVCS